MIPDDPLEPVDATRYYATREFRIRGFGADSRDYWISRLNADRVGESDYLHSDGSIRQINSPGGVYLTLEGAREVYRRYVLQPRDDCEDY